MQSDPAATRRAARAERYSTVAVCSHSGHALLEEEVAEQPVAPALEHRGPVVDAAHERVGDLEVVVTRSNSSSPGRGRRPWTGWTRGPRAPRPRPWCTRRPWGPC